MTGALAVESAGLTKRFGDQTVVAGIDLVVPRGSVYGFLGPNGSGKTTTIRMLLGLVRPTAGEHSLLGEAMPSSAASVLPRVGALVEGPAFHPYLSGRANLRRLDDADASTDPRDRAHRVDEALDRVGLLAAADKRYRAYSLGMGQRLGIAAALLSPRDLLVLDEPTNGLDPQGTREVRHLVSDLADEGRTVLVSSHLLAEVEQICTHIGVMNEGALVAQGPVAELRATTTSRAVVQTDRPADAARVLHELGLDDVKVDHAHASGLIGETPRTSVVPALVRAEVPVLGYAVEEPSLEDLFVSLTGEGFDVSG
ncbi:ABC transporter ATP-binding protein [Luteipulveratus mongoliensis]|uniref:Multidrug ABC transporter ATP-binding protein n=1 Tax=Luteipulveratus mongoliensis TaxID=571913 RepID=A0A0K1JHP7_9MICO|nr:ATP-binding cassette domain-containing protein [Luteipulveratus mongoliensis]AKU16216.1 multidrug ABC transporter ATP-binding protein [Luteipulveratus mongoliensis]